MTSFFSASIALTQRGTQIQAHKTFELFKTVKLKYALTHNHILFFYQVSHGRNNRASHQRLQMLVCICPRSMNVCLYFLYNICDDMNMRFYECVRVVMSYFCSRVCILFVLLVLIEWDQIFMHQIDAGEWLKINWRSYNGMHTRQILANKHEKHTERQHQHECNGEWDAQQWLNSAMVSGMAGECNGQWDGWSVQW